MLPLVLYINIFKIWLAPEGEALGDIAHCHDHILVILNTLDVFHICVDELFVKLNVVQI
jgi:hypothetical protein